MIYETDTCLDVDDVGGLAMLHALADKGEVEILAVSFNEVHPSSAAAIHLQAVEQWGVFETSFKAQPPAGSPMDVKFSATFKHG